MFNKHIRTHDQPLSLTELDICQRALNSSLFQLNIGKDTDEAEYVEAAIIELFQRGTCNERQLTALVSATRGRLYRRSL
jgi:hypothetical protein